MALKNQKKQLLIHKGLEALRNIEEITIILVLVVLCTILGFVNPRFLMAANVINILRQISTIGIVATGLAFVIMTGGMDMSTGSNVALGGMVCGALVKAGVNSWVALLLAVALGAAVGVVTGTIIMKLNINAFVATMGMMNIIKGFAYLVSEGMPIPMKSPMNFLGAGYFLTIPMMVWVMFFVLIVGHILLTKTVFGKNVLAVGGNPKAAKLSGISETKTRIIVYAMVAGLAALSGVLIAGNLGLADTAAGTGYELEFLAAVVIGGTPFGGGKGTIRGVFLGAAVMGIVKNAFVLLHISTYWQMVSIGLIVIFAIASDEIRKKRRAF